MIAKTYPPLASWQVGIFVSEKIKSISQTLKFG